MAKHAPGTPEGMTEDFDNAVGKLSAKAAKKKAAAAAAKKAASALGGGAGNAVSAIQRRRDFLKNI